jgi:hypothetical protein
MNGSVFPPRILHETTVIIVTAFVPADTAHGVSRRDPTKGERRLACPCEQGCGNMATSLGVASTTPKLEVRWFEHSSDCGVSRKG